MKFQQLKIGQAFGYEGDFFVKTSPLVASHAETGEQKLIPRYAVIAVTDTSTTPNDKYPDRNLNSNQVQTAFNMFYDCYLGSLQKLQADIELQALESFQDKVENARQLFLSELGLPDQATEPR